MDPLTLTGLMLLLPLASALVILLFHGLLKNVAHVVSTATAVIIFICALMLLGAKDNPRLLLMPFIEIGKFTINLSFLIDRQSRGMMFIVTFVGMLVHIYSLAYMKDDDARARYFGGLSLFMFSMTGI